MREARHVGDQATSSALRGPVSSRGPERPVNKTEVARNPSPRPNRTDKSASDQQETIGVRHPRKAARTPTLAPPERGGVARR
eukprot:9525225-Alexandrium_andersonii.AAC.1